MNLYLFFLKVSLLSLAVQAGAAVSQKLDHTELELVVDSDIGLSTWQEMVTRGYEPLKTFRALTTIG
jgi:hypothetical protein